VEGLGGSNLCEKWGACCEEVFWKKCQREDVVGVVISEYVY
jgi:hypothetical protein